MVERAGPATALVKTIAIYILELLAKYKSISIQKSFCNLELHILFWYGNSAFRFLKIRDANAFSDH